MKQRLGKQKPPVRKRKWFWPVVIIVVLLVIGSFSDKKDAAPADEAKTDHSAADTDTSGNAEALDSPDSPDEKEEEPETDASESDADTGWHTLPGGVQLRFSESIRNDGTGNRRLSETSDSAAPADYALEYYREMFESDEEIHAIWNAALNTTTKISASAGLLFVDTHAYVSGEEHDAKLLFSGDVIDRQIIDIKTGEPYSEAEEEPEEEAPPPEPEVQTPAEPAAPAAQPAADTGTPEQAVTVTPQQPANPANTGGSGNASNFDTYYNPELQQTSASYVLNTKTKKFHIPSCKDVSKMSAENYAESNQTRQEIMAGGYSPCGHCNP